MLQPPKGSCSLAPRQARTHTQVPRYLGSRLLTLAQLQGRSRAPTRSDVSSLEFEAPRKPLCHSLRQEEDAHASIVTSGLPISPRCLQKRSCKSPPSCMSLSCTTPRSVNQSVSKRRSLQTLAFPPSFPRPLLWPGPQLRDLATKQAPLSL